MERMEMKNRSKLARNADALAAQRWITDILTSIHTSSDIPGNAVLGPCDLKHTSLYDSIAFIALKCSDRRSAPYMARVDTSAANVSTEGPMWLRLVQSARSTEEQNLEAYVKNGQLFFRAPRKIQKDAELLAWYGKDLADLLSFSQVQRRTKGFPQYVCSDCNQSFQFEFPLLAHQRFLCTERLLIFNNRATKADGDLLKPGSLICPKLERCPQEGKPATDFHNLARDLENSRTSPPRDTEPGCTTKRRHSETEESEGGSQPLVLKGEPPIKRICTLKMTRQPCSTSSQATESETHAPTEVSKAGQSPNQSPVNLSSEQWNRDLNPSRVLFGTRPGRSEGDSSYQERKSAFIQPPRSIPQVTPLALAAKLPHGQSSIRHTAFSSSLAQANLHAAKPQGSTLLHGGLLKPGALLYSTGLWPRTSALLPSSLSPLCLPAQNWCAKCNISFHMTSDLVHHMRSHHSRAPSEEQRAKQHREERLKCHICKETFRERHHLSRHMISHT